MKYVESGSREDPSSKEQTLDQKGEMDEDSGLSTTAPPLPNLHLETSWD